MPVDTDSDNERKPLCASERLKLERLCRYITRPALANDRFKINGQRQVELKQKIAVARWHHASWMLPSECSTQT
jgi:hypothetical protein